MMRPRRARSPRVGCRKEEGDKGGGGGRGLGGYFFGAGVSVCTIRPIANEHTATHRNTPQHTQHTAIHRNTLQHTLQHTATHCNTLIRSVRSEWWAERERESAREREREKEESLSIDWIEPISIDTSIHVYMCILHMYI